MKELYEIKEEHLQECADLYVKVFNAAPWNDEWTVETAYKRLQDIYIAPNFVGFLYKEENEVKGAVFGNREQWFEGMHYNLKEMFVSNELQGSGVGSKIMKALEENLKKLDVNTVILFTSKGNKTSSFYEKNDFKELKSMAMMLKSLEV